MPYPVPPPQPPAIIQPFPHEQLPYAASADDSGVATPENHRHSAARFVLPKSSASVASAPVGEGEINQNISKKNEREPSSYSAAELGSSLSVGVSVEPVTDASDLALEAIAANLAPAAEPAVADKEIWEQGNTKSNQEGEQPISETLNLEPQAALYPESEKPSPDRETTKNQRSTESAIAASPARLQPEIGLSSHQPDAQIAAREEAQKKVSPQREGIPPFSATQSAQEEHKIQHWLKIVNTEDASFLLAQDPIESPSDLVEILPAPHMAPIGPSQTSQTTPLTSTPPLGQQPPPPGLGSPGVIEVTADRQDFNEQQQVFTAEGNVIVRFQGAVIDANRVQGNLRDFIAVAEGDASLRRGQQIFRGSRFVYNFVQNTGNFQNGSGTVFATTSGPDLTFVSETGSYTAVPDRPLSDRLLEGQPPQQIIPTGSFQFGVGRRQFGASGNINRVRFEADQVEFYPRGWTATNVRLTNDPFSPPELELRADRAVFRQLSPLRDEILLTNSRIVFDQGLSIPTFRRRIIIDRTEREPPLFQWRYDARERGGVYIERTFDVINTEQVSWTITPQFLVQRAITEEGGNIFSPASWGVRSAANITLGPTTTVQARLNTPTLFLNELADEMRASVRLRQVIGTRLPHTLTLEYSYRDRLFNGSLGFRTVRSSIGAVITSPNIPIGKTGINLTYQGGIQYVTARTDRFELIEFDPVTFLIDDDIISLGRFQASAQLVRPWFLWRGKPLPPTGSQGLRYTPVPVVPFIQLVPVIRGVATWYTNEDYQNYLLTSLTLQGQFGHFSKTFLDFTGFNVTYARIFNEGLSPFLFDRVADTEVLSFGITQQLIGPIRFGFQTAINLDTGEVISTDYTLEYSRRTYSVVIRFNPEKEQGSLNLVIRDFNWTGGGDPFGGSGGRFVDAGVVPQQP